MAKLRAVFAEIFSVLTFCLSLFPRLTMTQFLIKNNIDDVIIKLKDDLPWFHYTPRPSSSFDLKSNRQGTVWPIAIRPPYSEPKFCHFLILYDWWRRLLGWNGPVRFGYKICFSIDYLEIFWLTGGPLTLRGLTPLEGDTWTAEWEGSTQNSCYYYQITVIFAILLILSKIARIKNFFVSLNIIVPE